MVCKYPKDSRSYHFCIGCSDKKFCTIAPIPKVKPPKKDEADIEKAIIFLIDNGYSVTKLN